jgi:5-methylthioadenosine/S-adenosylhomocysteine deaminase
MTQTLIVAERILTGFAPDGEALILDDAAILVADDRIVAIDAADTLRRAHPRAAVVGGRGRVAMPGLVNGHHHVGLTPFQLGAADQSLELWFAERLVMRDVDPRLDTLFSAFEMVASGVTTVQHLHSRAPGGPDAVVARAGAILGAYADLGMRVSYSFALRDQNRMIYAADAAFIEMLPPQARAPMAAYLDGFSLPLSDQIGVFRALRQGWAGNPGVAIQIAPSNLHWLSDAALEQAAHLSAETGAPMHMHLLETPYQKAYAQRRTGGSAMAHIDRLGLLGPRMTIGHGTWMTPDDLALLAERGACLCHNCSSNLRLKSGTLDLNAVLAAGVPCALGIDEAGINDDRDMLQEMRLAMTLHRPAGHDAPAPTAAQILRMATEHGGATTPFAERIGRLAPGMFADILVLDWDAVTRPWQDPSMPLAEVLVRRARAHAGAVETVMVGGAVIYDAGRFTRIDRDEVHDAIGRALATPETADATARRALSRAAMPVVRSFYRDWTWD